MMLSGILRLLPREGLLHVLGGLVLGGHQLQHKSLGGHFLATLGVPRGSALGSLGLLGEEHPTSQVVGFSKLNYTPPSYI